jgi:hypothetical protein
MKCRILECVGVWVVGRVLFPFWSPLAVAALGEWMASGDTSLTLFFLSNPTPFTSTPL